MKSKPVIAFLIPDLKNGGGQRVCAVLMNNLIHQGYDITCLVFDQTNIQFEISDSIKIASVGIDNKRFIYRLGIIGFIIKVLKVKAALRKTKPDLVFPMMTSMNIIGWFANRKAKIILNHHTFVKEGSVKYWLIKYFYRWADLVIVPSYGLASELKRIDEKIKVQRIPNPIDVSFISRQSKEHFDQNRFGKYLLYVGRLSKEKEVDLLIEAFKTIEHLPFNLVIIGDGPDEDRLKKISRALNISHKIYFVGPKTNPFQWMKNATCMILPSRVESFGMVLLEAMASSCKVVAFNCSGPNELTDAGTYGWLANRLNKEDLALTILNCIQGDFHENTQQWVDQYNLPLIGKQYHEWITRIIEQKKL